MINNYFDNLTIMIIIKAIEERIEELEKEWWNEDMIKLYKEYIIDILEIRQKHFNT